MNKKLLVTSICWQWLIIILAVVVGFYEESQLTGDYLKMLKIEESIELSSIQDISLIIASIFTLIFLVSSIAICLLKRWGRTWYLISYVGAMISILPAYMPTLVMPVALILDGVSSILFGFVVALGYFSPISEKFKRQ